MGTDGTIGGRGVSRQAAGFPITLGVLLHPLPSTLPSSRTQPEVSTGQARSSLCHYPSITCRPLSADNRTFFCLFTPRTSFSSLWSLTPSSFFSPCLTLPLWFSHLFLLSICSPAPFPFLAFYLFLFALLIALHHFQFPSVVFPHRLRELRGLSFWDLLCCLLLISRFQQRYYTPAAAFTDRLQIELNSFREGSLVSL